MISLKEISRNNVSTNYFTALLIFLISFISIPSVKIGLVGEIFLGLCFLSLYFLETWAFNLKIRLSRARVLMELTDGDPKSPLTHKSIGGLVWYGFLIRLIFRFLIMLIALNFLHLMRYEGKELSGWTLALLIIAMLFELYSLMIPMIDSGVDSYKERTEERRKRAQVAEVKWREENFLYLRNKELIWKEPAADILLTLYAIIPIKFFWGMVNNTFSSYIIGNARDGWGPIETAFGVAIPVFILSLFFLIPVRLAYWVGESIRVNSAAEKRHYYLSLCVACLVIMIPTLDTFWRTFFLGY
jgi:hypothetical protein